MCDHARIHHAESERRHVREHDYHRETRWQLRRVVEMTQRLIQASRIRMMIGATL
jgi:hypothetical protein